MCVDAMVAKEKSRKNTTKTCGVDQTEESVMKNGKSVHMSNVKTMYRESCIPCERKRRKQAKFRMLKRYNGLCAEGNRDPLAAAMAPTNTTQYLMEMVYEDMRRDTLNPYILQENMFNHSFPDQYVPSAYDDYPIFTHRMDASTDGEYGRTMDFQLKDFEKVYMTEM